MLIRKTHTTRTTVSADRTLRQQLRAHWRPYLVVHLLFSLLGVSLLTPLSGLLLQGLLALSGSPAVADQDIAWLLLSPIGLLSAILLASVLLAIVGLELGALQCVSLAACRGHACSPVEAVFASMRRAPAILRLTLGLTLRVLAWTVPFVALIGAVAAHSLSPRSRKMARTSPPISRSSGSGAPNPWS